MKIVFYAPKKIKSGASHNVGELPRCTAARVVYIPPYSYPFGPGALPRCTAAHVVYIPPYSFPFCPGALPRCTAARVYIPPYSYPFCPGCWSRGVSFIADFSYTYMRSTGMEQPPREKPVSCLFIDYWYHACPQTMCRK